MGLSPSPASHAAATNGRLGGRRLSFWPKDFHYIFPKGIIAKKKSFFGNRISFLRKKYGNFKSDLLSNQI
jgi:hypothetical protein